MLSYGVINGTNETTCDPDSLVTRQDAVTMIYRAGIIADIVDNESNTIDMTDYVDYKEVSSYAKDAVIWNVEKGIIVSRTKTTLASHENITRAEISVVINRFLNLSGLIN